MTSPLLLLNTDASEYVLFEMQDAVSPEADRSGFLLLEADAHGNVVLNVNTQDGGDGAGLYISRQGALDLAHALINLVHPHAG